MSLEALTWVLKHSDARLGERLVLIVLADHADDDGTETYPSVPTIAAKARLSERQVQNCLKKLVADKRLRKDGRSSKGTTKYAIVMGGANSSPRNPPQSGVQNRTENVSDFSPEPSIEPPALFPSGKEPPTPSGENAGSKSKTPQATTSSPELAEAWSHWSSLAQPRNAEPTPSQMRMLERALREASLDLVKQAMTGLIEWRKERGGDLSLSRIFKTRPGGDSLTDQIAWWAGQSGGPGGSNGLTSEALAKINRLKDHVRRDVNRGEALNRLSEEYGIVGKPIPQGDRDIWKFEVGDRD